MTPPLDALRFVDANGASLSLHLRLCQQVKDNYRGNRQTLRVTDGQRDLALKLHTLDRWRLRLSAAFGRSLLRHEARMLRAATRAGLPVPALLAVGSARRDGLPVREALLLEWLPVPQILSSALRSAHAQGDSTYLEQAATALADLFGRIRNAGLADTDFGVHNLLVQQTTPSLSFAWIDLEAAFLAAPQNPAATAKTLGSLLATWWVNSDNDEHRLHALFDLLLRHVPPGTCPTPQLTTLVNTCFQRRTARAILKGSVARQPPAL